MALPASPYADVERRVHMMFTNAKQVGSDPQAIAEVIEEAIVSNASRCAIPPAPTRLCRHARA